MKWLLKTKLLLHWDPYVKGLRQRLSHFEILDETLDRKKQALFNRLILSKDPFCSKRLQEWENLIQEIHSHNQEVEELKKEAGRFSLNSALSCPKNYKDADLENLRILFSSIQNFSNHDSGTRSFLKDAEEFLANFSSICVQYALFQELEKTQNPLPLRYFDLASRKKFQRQEEALIQQASSFKKLYYPFFSSPELPLRLSKCNLSWLQNAEKDPLFDDINGVSLDSEQRRAILKEDQCCLVVAGAGSGKTKTIVGKVRYLLEKEKVDPSEILLLSYSKKSADDLQKQVNSLSPNLKVGTFHKIGLDILTEKKGHRLAVEDQFDAILESFFREEMPRSKELKRRFLEYYALFLFAPEKGNKYQDEGERLK